MLEGDVVVVTQKVVSKAEGRIVAVDRPTPTQNDTSPNPKPSAPSGAGATWS